MNWEEFDAKSDDGWVDNVTQGANHATARYFVLYLQEQGRLKDVYTTFRTATVEEMFTASEDRRMGMLEALLMQPSEEIDRNFELWFMEIGDWKADSGQVREAQRKLRDAGFDPGPIDGSMGPKTQKAIRAFQEARQLPVNGRLHALTLEALGLSHP
jgi:hypothetical protein